MHSKLVQKLFLYLGENLTVRAKRLILISSAAAIYHKAIVNDNELIASLNRTLNLAKSNKAAAYPMYIKDLVWEGCDEKAIASKIPPWLRYPEASQDLLNLTRFLQTQKPQTS